MNQTERIGLNLPERTDIYNLDVYNRNFIILDSLIGELQDMIDSKFEISSFSASPSSVSSGVDTTINMSWSFNNNNNIDSISINGTSLNTTDRSYSTSVNLTSSKTFTLSVVRKGTTFTKSVTISIKAKTYNFYYGNYGTTEDEVLNITPEIVKGLTKKTQTTRVMDVNISLESTEKYIIFAIPTSLADNLVIYVNDFMGGIETIKQLTIDNIQYNIMRSDYPYTNELTNTMKISIKN